MKLAALALLVSSAGSATACGAAQKPGAATPSDAARAFPVLTHVPAGATWFLAVAQLDHGVELLGNLAQPLLPPFDEGPLRGALGGVSPFSPPDLAEVGFARARSAVLYGVGLLPTLVLPVADDVKVSQYLERLFHESTVHVTDYRGVHVTTWGPEYGFTLAWGIIESPGESDSGHWLAVHLGVESVDPTPLGWLDVILDARGGAAGTADTAWALGLAGRYRDALGFVRYPELAAALARLEMTGAPTGARRIAFYALLTDRDAGGAGFIELEPEARSLVAAATSDAPAFFAEARDSAAIYLAVNVDPAQLGPSLARIFDLAPLRAFRLAIGGGVLSGTQVALSAVLWARLADPAQVAGILDGVFPPRQRIQEAPGGAAISKAVVPALAPPIEWILGDDELRMMTGRRVDERFVASPIVADGELVALRVDRDRISDIAALGRALGITEGFPAEALERLRSVYRHVSFALTLSPGGIRMEGAFELR